MNIEQIVEKLKTNCLYDFIANNYNELTKEQLKNIILELDNSIYTAFCKNTYKEIETTFIENLKERE